MRAIRWAVLLGNDSRRNALKSIESCFNGIDLNCDTAALFPVIGYEEAAASAHPSSGRRQTTARRCFGHRISRRR
ncbi:hypothetical protein CH282_12670 [Rhodococcus sp. 06-418-1B]|nr:hypothetical protein CH282_12670 [Rhodococcus sp. 06-418-1B]